MGGYLEPARMVLSNKINGLEEKIATHPIPIPTNFQGVRLSVLRHVKKLVLKDVVSSTMSAASGTSISVHIILPPSITMMEHICSTMQVILHSIAEHRERVQDLQGW